MDTLDGAQTTVQRNFKGAKILLIEDNPDHVRLTQASLQRCMPEVELLTAAAPEQARSVLETASSLPRLILVDLYLPTREEGLQLVQWLKNPALPYRMIPITMLSQSKKDEDIQLSYQAGVNSYITKPANFSQWLGYFESLRQYWWHTVTLPPG